ncbi:hypothetical protein MXB_2715, partial [Myxobolus squamalis]
MISKRKTAKVLSKFVCLSSKEMENIFFQKIGQFDLGKLIKKHSRVANMTDLTNVKIFETIEADNCLTQKRIKEILSDININSHQYSNKNYFFDSLRKEYFFTGSHLYK